MTTKNTRVLGFSLIELMVALAIAAILAVIAVPSYRQYVMRSNRTEAMGALMNIAANQESFYLQNNAYSEDLNDLGYPDEATEHGYYNLATSSTTPATDFTATATATGGQADDEDCATLTIDQNGTRTSDPEDAAVCWR